MNKYDLNEQLAPHFKLREFLHGDSLEGVTATIYANLKTLAGKLENIRAQFGNRAITINSGFRTAEHNRRVGGAPKSQHLYGKAADITVAGLHPSEVQEGLKSWGGGLGSYKTWSHIDTGSKRRWSE